MGVSHSLFYSSNSEEQTLHKRITPNDKQFDEQRARWKDLAEYLLTYVSEETGLTSKSWLQGSYKFGTQIRPSKVGDEFDIDLGVYMVWKGATESGPLGAKELKNLIQSGLKAYKAVCEDLIEVTSPKAKCARARFRGNFHIDVPSYHLDAERDARALATEGDCWEPSDPKALFLWFQNRFDEHDRKRIRRLVTYLKMWAALNCPPARRLSSIAITVLAAEAYRLVNSEAQSADDDCLAQASQTMLTRLKRDAKILNPVDKSENLNRLGGEEFSAFLHSLTQFEALAALASEAESKLEAASLWSQAYGHFFPGVEVADALPASKSITTTTFIPEVGVVATTRGLNQHQYTGRNTIGPIPKDCDIRFKLLNAHQLPQRSSVRWTVRNEGEEAESRNDLGHTKIVGAHSVEERSSYKGTHFMDVSVVLPTGRVLGHRRVPVIVLGYTMPPRNRKRPNFL